VYARSGPQARNHNRELAAGYQHTPGPQAACRVAPGTPNRPPAGEQFRQPRHDREGDRLERALAWAQRRYRLLWVPLLLGLAVLNVSSGQTYAKVSLRNGDRSVKQVPSTAVFVMIGAVPHTDWLPSSIQRDSHGYVKTGHDLLQGTSVPETWPLRRLPWLLETSVPGVFAVGDVRYRSVKRVAAAVGEGSTAIQLVHQYLAEPNQM
jgi:thioredoxin reductase